MAGEFIEFFEELLFGSGAWLGLILIVSIAFLVVSQVKYSSVFFAVIFLFLGIFYLEEVSSMSNFIWAVVIVWFMIPVLVLSDITRHRR